MSSVRQIVREPDIFMFPQWSEYLSYYTNSIVSYYDSDSSRHKFYIAQDGVNIGDVPAYSQSWLEFSYDSDHLTNTIERLWAESFTYFQNYLKGAIDSDSKAIYGIVDSELREVRADVNISLLNNLAITKVNIDSESLAIKRYVDQRDTRVMQALDSESKVIKRLIDSDRVVLTARDTANFNYLSTRIAQEIANHDSDMNTLNAKFLAEQQKSLIKFLDIDSDSLKLKDVQRQVLTLFTNFGVLQTLINTNNVKVNNLDSDFKQQVLTHVLIYKDIQSNRDRIIALEASMAAEIQSLITNNATLNSSILNQLSTIYSTLTSHDNVHLSLFNDIADLRSKVNRLNSNSQIDSDFLQKYITKLVINNKGTDSEWVIKWVNQKANPQVDSDWVMKNTISLDVPTDVTALMTVVKDNLDFGTF